MGFLVFLLVLGIILLALSVAIGFYAWASRWTEPVEGQVPVSELFTDGE